MPKILGDSIADHRDQVRQRLFAALSELIARRGYDAITLADIAAAAGLGRTAVYNHFPDKESMLLAWAEDETTAYLVRLRRELARTTDPVTQLRTFLAAQMRELARHHSRLAGIGTALSVQGRVSIREHIAPMMEILTDILQRGIDSGELPPQDLTMTVSMISAVASARFVTGLVGAALNAAIDEVVAFVVHGIGAR